MENASILCELGVSVVNFTSQQTRKIPKLILEKEKKGGKEEKKKRGQKSKGVKSALSS